MKIVVSSDSKTLGRAAAAEGVSALRAALRERDRVTIVIATGASQFETLESLVNAPDIDWSRVDVFHLDEYIGLPATHGASFRRYLQERFVRRLPGLGTFVPVQGCARDVEAELGRLNELLEDREVDVCFAGIGENGHLAFNDPPADIDSPTPYLRVTLDDACRRQQVGEGWFGTLDEVPKEAISMSIVQILKSRALILSVPDARKAPAVERTVHGRISNMHPASVLQRHGNCTLFLDTASASLLH